MKWTLCSYTLSQLGLRCYFIHFILQILAMTPAPPYDHKYVCWKWNGWLIGYLVDSFVPISRLSNQQSTLTIYPCTYSIEGFYLVLSRLRKC